MHNSFILQQYVCYTTILNMFRAARCSSSGGQIVSPQPLAPELNAQFLYSSTICMLHYDPQHVSSSTFAHPQEDKLYHHSLWYRHPL